MARQVWKYTFVPGHGYRDLAVPKGAHFLHASFQGLALCVWAQVRVEEPEVENRRLFLAETGKPLPDGVALLYLSTCQPDTGLTPYVLHVYEVEE